MKLCIRLMLLLAVSVAAGNVGGRFNSDSNQDLDVNGPGFQASSNIDRSTNIQVGGGTAGNVASGNIDRNNVQVVRGAAENTGGIFHSDLNKNLDVNVAGFQVTGNIDRRTNVQVVKGAAVNGGGSINSNLDGNLNVNGQGFQASGHIDRVTNIKFGKGTAMNDDRVDRSDPILIMAEENDDEEVTVEDVDETFNFVSARDPSPASSISFSSPTTVNVDVNTGSRDDDAGPSPIFSPLIEAVRPLSDAFKPISDAFSVPDAATLASFSVATKKILAAKAVLAAPLVGLGAAVAAPFVKVGAKVVALIVKGKVIVGAKILKLAFLKGAAVGKLGALAVAIPAAIVGEKIFLVKKLIAGKAALTGAFLAGKAVPISLVAGGLAALEAKKLAKLGALGAAAGTLLLQPVGDGTFRIIQAPQQVSEPFQIPTVNFESSSKLTIDHPSLQVDHSSNADFHLGPEAEEPEVVEEQEESRMRQPQSGRTTY
jgi:hypothetical protein